jgi:nucleoside-diphosphate-sugar epimerase
VAVVRLPLTVHGNGDRSFIPALIRLARVKGVSAYSGEGVNIWPTVHRLDAVQVFCLAIENDFLPGTRFHAVAESVQFRQIAETIGKRLGLPVKGVFAQEVQRHFGWLAPFAAMNNPSSSAKTQEALQWHPVQISLNDDLEQEHYYE